MYLNEYMTSYAAVPLALGSLLASYLMYSLLRGLYYAFLHPLSRYPGPKLRAAFWWPSYVSIWHGTEHKDTAALHEKYGPLVRIGPTELSYTAPEAWKEIYGFRPSKKPLQKDPGFYATDKKDGVPKDIIFTLDDTDHARFRRLLAHAFSDAALRSQEEILQHYFALLVKKLNAQIDSPEVQGKVDIVDWYNYATFDIVADLSFGESFHALENGVHHPWVQAIFASLKYSRFLRLGVRYPLFGRLIEAAIEWFPSIREQRARHVNFAAARTQKRLDAETDRKDFITYILRHNDKRGMTRDEIIANTAILVIAGSETSGTLLAGCTYYLLRNPAALAILQREVRQAFSRPEDITLVATAKLPYLHAVIEESLRIYPPVTISLPRLVPQEGATIAGETVPGGTSVSMQPWATYHSPTNFANPYTFAPERWLEGDQCPEVYRDDKRAALQPFSLGPRGCLGMNLAYNEMRVIMARMVWHFDMELCRESRDWEVDQKVYQLVEKPPLWIKLSRRAE